MPLSIRVAYDVEATSVVSRHRPDHPAVPQLAELAKEIGDAPAVCEALAADGHDAQVLPLGSDAAQALAALGSSQPDLVVNLCDTLRGRGDLAMTVPAMLALQGIPFAGADAVGLALSKRKHDVKNALCREGLPTPRYQVLSSAESLATFELGLEPPVIVKPTGEHASIGIEAASVCFTREEVAARARVLIERFGAPALVEEYVEGRELYVSIIGDPPRPLRVMEHTYEHLPEGFLKVRTFDFKWFEDPALGGDAPVRERDPRWSAGVPVRKPAVPFAGSLDELGPICVRAFLAGGCRDWGRVDLRMDAGRVPLIIDVTPNTYLSPGGPCARAGLAEGIDFRSLIRAIVQGALDRRVPR